MQDEADYQYLVSVERQMAFDMHGIIQMQYIYILYNLYFQVLSAVTMLDLSVIDDYSRLPCGFSHTTTSNLSTLTRQSQELV